jgi:hypothetical protein
MNDRELIDNAARAAGIVLAHGRNVTDVHPSSVHYLTAPYWEPLTDDGDAIRLAVSLELDLNLGQLGTLVYMKRGVKNIEELSEDCMAAFRRAIVRAAAAIGAAMNSEGN